MIKDGILTAVLVVLTWLIALDQFRVSRSLLRFEHLNDWMALVGAGVFLLAVLQYFRERCSRKKGSAAELFRAIAPGAGLLALFSFSGWFGSHPECLSVDLIKAYALLEDLRFYLCAFLAFFLFRSVRFEDLPDVWKALTALLVSAPAGIILVSSWIDFRYRKWPTQMWRFGLRSQQLFYGHPTNLAMACVFLMFLLLWLRERFLAAEKGAQEGLLVRVSGYVMLSAAALLLVPMMLTLRIRVFGLLAGMAVLFVWCVVLKKQLKLWMIPLIGAGVLAIGWRRIVRHYFAPEVLNAARGAMLRASLDLCRTCFPLGAGFGNFGSRMAQHFYSPLYIYYGMTEIEGMTPAWPSYACDSFWAMVLGETGVLGTVSFLLLMVWLFQTINRRMKAGSAVYFSALSLLLYEAVETSATLAFSEFNGYAFGLLLGLLFTGCGEALPAASAGKKLKRAGKPRSDTGKPGDDAGKPGSDAGKPGEQSGRGKKSSSRRKKGKK